MDIFQIMTIISFCLSTYLTIQSIYNSLVRVEIDILALYKMSNIIFLKVSINNLSSNPLAITSATLSNTKNSVAALGSHHEKRILKNTYKENNVVVDTQKLFSDKIPINISKQSARSVFIAFPISKNNIDQLCDNNLSLDLKINKKYISSNFNFISKNSPIEQLKKELKM